ncbi:MAG: TatD family hydrolase [Betaproteobacteria bacterium]|nr:TatD family hydrolase [Betaproteobacteria bacterium]
MYIDSHCHLDFPELAREVPELLARMAENQVSHALCISVELAAFPQVLALAEAHEALYATVGVHPDYPDTIEPTVEMLVAHAQHPKVVGIGETGLDYYRLSGDLEWQRKRFRVHIQAAQVSHKPLVIHTRNAAADTLDILRALGPVEAGGVFHCFTEDWEVAEAALELGFLLSFSGIVTFRSATQLKEVARRCPLDRLLIETDAPYLAPVPHRGKRNEPAFVRHVGEEIARLKGLTPETVGEASSANFRRLFKISAGGGAR